MTAGICLQCDRHFERKARGGADRLKFCSKSCAATCNNRKRARGRVHPYPREICPQCGGIKSSSTACSTPCRACQKANRLGLVAAVTLGELRASHSTLAYHAKIRMYARETHDGRACVACGYRLHVDVCHVRPVKAFPSSATLAEVNRPENLIALCPNHHWEFDNGHLDLVVVAGVGVEPTT